MKNIILIIITAVIVSICVQYFIFQKDTPTDNLNTESAFERVLRTGTLKCGYNFWSPFLYKNEERHQLEGLSIDLMDALAHIAHLKVEWTSILNWDSIALDLKTGKADVNCGPLFATATRAKSMLFTHSYGYQTLEPFVRKNDNRFQESSWEKLNTPHLRIVGWEGTPTLEAAKLVLPKATYINLPSHSSTADAYTYIATGKADVFFDSFSNAKAYMQNNPGKIKRANKEMIISQHPLALGVAQGEHDLAAFLNTALLELTLSGEISRILKKYSDALILSPKKL